MAALRHANDEFEPELDWHDFTEVYDQEYRRIRDRLHQLERGGCSRENEQVWLLKQLAIIVDRLVAQERPSLGALKLASKMYLDCRTQRACYVEKQCERLGRMICIAVHKASSLAYRE